MKVIPEKYAIRVYTIEHGEKSTIGYISFGENKALNVRQADGKLSDYRIKLLAAIADTSFIPWFESRQECLKVLSTFSDMFFESYGFFVEKLPS